MKQLPKVHGWISELQIKSERAHLFSVMKFKNLHLILPNIYKLFMVCSFKKE